MRRLSGLIIFSLVVVSLFLLPQEGIARGQAIPESVAEVLEEQAMMRDKILSLKSLSEKTFQATVTAYYLPKPGQKKYAHGSYLKDIRVNGRGKTSTGAKVFVGGAATSNLEMAPIGSTWLIKNVTPDGSSVIVVINDVMGEQTPGKLKFDVFRGEGDAGLNEAMRVGRKMHIAIRVS